MNLCDHGLDQKSCVLCKKFAAAQNAVEMYSSAPQSTMTMTTPMPGAPPMVVQIPNAHPDPEITDPTAKLAQEYSRDLEEMATIRDAVQNTRNLLKALEADMAACQARCSEKGRKLLGGMEPPKVRKPRTPKVVAEVAG
jgi:hypothetical protein